MNKFWNGSDGQLAWRPAAGPALVYASGRAARLDVTHLAQLGNGSGEGIGVLAGDLLQRGHEFGG